MPIQMIGTRRSGSNLLRVMIGQLEGMYAPQSTHMLEYYMPLVPYYGDLNDPEVFSSLVNDMCICVEQNPVKWEGVTLDREKIAASCKSRSVMDIFDAIYTFAAEQSNCTQWMCKCLGYINYFQQFEEYYSGKMKYIYIYRDGRDVALSFYKAIAGRKHPYFIAKEWANTQKLASKIRSSVTEDRFYAVCYEDLLENPEQKCRGIADFIGLPFTENMLNYHQSSLAKSSAASSALWGNISKPIIANNKQKYLKNMLPGEVKIFENVAGTVLDELGYPRHYTIFGHDEQKYGDNELAEFERIDEKRKLAVIASQNPEDMKRRNIQKNYVDEVKERLGCVDVVYHGNMIHSSEKEKSQRRAKAEPEATV